MSRLKYPEGSTVQASCYIIHVSVPDAMTSRGYGFSFSTLRLRYIHVKKTQKLQLWNESCEKKIKRYRKRKGPSKPRVLEILLDDQRDHSTYRERRVYI